MTKGKYEIIKKLGVISTSENGWKKEVNIISWDGKEPQFDVRDWAPDHSDMGEGVVFTKEEAEKLSFALDEHFLFVLENEPEQQKEVPPDKFLEDEPLYQAFYKWLIKGFAVYNAKCVNCEFENFQREFLFALECYAKGESIPDFYLGVTYETRDSVAYVHVKLSGPMINIVTGGNFERHLFAALAENWFVNLNIDGTVQNDCYVNSDDFEIFPKLLELDGVKVEFFMDT